MTALVLMSRETFVEQFDERRLARLTALTPTCDPVHVTGLDALTKADLAQVDILLTGWGRRGCTSRGFSGSQLRAVLHCAGSVKSLVSPDLWHRGIQVSSAAEMNAIPVAEFTLAAIIMAGKKAPFLAADARRHRQDWGYRTSRGPLSNLGLTVGVVGFSKIGRRVVDRLQQLDDITCLVADPFADPDDVAAAGGQLVTLAELLPRVDVLSIHAPQLPSTHHLIGHDELAQLGDHATVINTARGSLVDTEALTAECLTGRLQAILDVTDPEPLPADSPLYDLPNVMLTPHIAGSLDSEILRMTDAALDELQRLREGQPLRFEVAEEDLPVLA